MHDEHYFRLLTPLWNLYAEGDEAGMRAAVMASHDELAARIDDLAIVPEAVRDDTEVAQAWVQFLLVMAEMLADAGSPELRERITGPVDNPIEGWYEALDEADRLRDDHEYAASTDKLVGLLADVSGAQGSAVDRLLPAALGLLGANAFDTGDVGRALTLTEQALERCEAMADAEGVRIYSENLATIRAEAEADPDTSEIRQRLARGQVLHDTARLEEARGVVQAVLESLPKEPSTYHPKAFGLMGMVAYRLGDLETAASTTQAAIDTGRLVGDETAIVIYGANLEVIHRAAERE